MAKKMSTDQFAELAAAVMRSLPRDVASVEAQKWIRDQRGLEWMLRRLGVYSPSQIYASELIPQGFKVKMKGGEVVDDAPPQIFDMNMGDLEYVRLGFSVPVDGYKVREFAAENGCNLGLSDIAYVLKHQREISSRGLGCILFPGTILISPDPTFEGDVMPMLVQEDGAWTLRWASVKGCRLYDCSFLRIKSKVR